MITAPYSGIKNEIVSVMQKFISDDDAYHQGHARRIARTLEVLLDQTPVGRLLELGTSSLVPIALSHLAPSLVVTVTTFDLSLPKNGTTLLTMNDESTECLQTECFRVDLETMPIPCADATFDFVICCEVIEHMERDPMFMLAEINRVMRPGGTLIVTTPNIASSRGIAKILRGIEPYFFMQYNTSGSLYRHNYEYSIHSLASLVRAAGFKGSIWTENTFEDPNFDDMARLKSAGYSIMHTGDNIFTVAKKVGPVIDRMPLTVYIND